MKTLLLALSLILTSLSLPALADHILLEDGKGYTDYVVLCGLNVDAMGYIKDLKQIPIAPNEYITVEGMITTAQNNNCSFQSQYFVYTHNKYVCGFTITYSNFTLLHTEIEGIRQSIIVFANISQTADSKFIPCLLDS